MSLHTEFTPSPAVAAAQAQGWLLIGWLSHLQLWEWDACSRSQAEGTAGLGESLAPGAAARRAPASSPAAAAPWAWCHLPLVPHLLLVHSATREGTATTSSTGQDLSLQRRLGIFLSLSFCNCIFTAVVTFKSCFELITSFLGAGTHATGGPGLCLTRVVKAQAPKADDSSSPNPYSYRFQDGVLAVCF